MWGALFAPILSLWWRFPPPLYDFDGAFRPPNSESGALSAPTQDMLLKYSLDLPYIQTEVWRSVTIGSKRYSSEIS